MSILSNIFNRIFHHGGSAQPQQGDVAVAARPDPAATSAAAAGVAAQGSAQATAAASPVDVAQVMDGLAGQNSQKLNWRSSIVDLMKLLDLDSSLQARKELATELGYSGAKDGSAEMNMWLHKQVMQKLAENGGKVPAELK